MDEPERCSSCLCAYPSAQKGSGQAADITGIPYVTDVDRSEVDTILNGRA